MLTPFDKQLIKKLEQLKRQIGKERTMLYGVGHGCACDEDSFCAHHAAISNLLVEAMGKVDQAMKSARSR